MHDNRCVQRAKFGWWILSEQTDGLGALVAQAQPAAVAPMPDRYCLAVGRCLCCYCGAHAAKWNTALHELLDLWIYRLTGRA